ncbi:Uncharacterized protein BP5553_05594 [Venustampulla echinocandica]|uniref:Major facilitator superfamily (MFS) profile domain-containing protein n=1 Tax=Venustampulla echinocandica TaxID=2656787 RepID=A0A370TRL1_9HELO|nr:Uncharacterized protein BP5553_05594 [Venustampulla echinocandica]RDL38161.1 Uncharacterized protein BP5553_05594 [Venustampulla echinocandica]
MAIAIKESSLWANRKCLLICCAVGMANMQYGFDSAAIGALQAMPGFLKVFGYADPKLPSGYGIDKTVQQLIASLLTLGSFATSLIAGFFGSYFGRKPALWAACLLNAIACAIQISTTNKPALYVGRLILGFANGFFVTFSNVYTAEASPAHLRGVMVAMFAYWVNVGSILGSIVVNYTKRSMTKSSYQIPIGCLYIVPTILCIALFFVPESPRWLLYRGRDAEARRSLEILRGGIDQTDIDLEWAEMLRGVEEEKKALTTAHFWDMFKGVNLRRTLLCYGMIACQTASGIWFLIGYQTYFLTISGVGRAFEFSIVSTCLGFLGVNCGMYAMRHWVGRRWILIIGAVTCGLSHLSSAIAATVRSPTDPVTGKVLVAFTCLIKFFYNGCVGGASYPVATEVVNSQLRTWTVGTATSIGYLLAWLTSFCSPYFINPSELNWGAKYGYIWAGSNFLCIIFFFFFIPEMKGRTLEELDEIFAAKVSARKFSAYECRIKYEAERDVKGKVEDVDAVSVHVDDEKREEKTV